MVERWSVPGRSSDHPHPKVDVVRAAHYDALIATVAKLEGMRNSAQAQLEEAVGLVEVSQAWTCSDICSSAGHNPRCKLLRAFLDRHASKSKE